MTTKFWWYVNHYSKAGLLIGVDDEGKVHRVLCGHLGWASQKQKAHYQKKLLGHDLEKAVRMLSKAWELHDVVTVEWDASALAVMLKSVRQRFPESAGDSENSLSFSSAPEVKLEREDPRRNGSSH